MSSDEDFCRAAEALREVSRTTVRRPARGVVLGVLAEIEAALASGVTWPRIADLINSTIKPPLRWQTLYQAYKRHQAASAAPPKTKKEPKNCGQNESQQSCLHQSRSYLR